MCIPHAAAIVRKENDHACIQDHHDLAIQTRLTAFGHAITACGRLSLTLVATCVVALVVASGGARLAPHALAATAYYQITDLGTLGGDYSYAEGINDRVLSVGWAGNTIPDPYFGTQSRAVVWTSSTPTDLGTIAPGGADAYAQNINDAGEIVGLSPVSTTNDPVFGIPDSHATLWYHGTIHRSGHTGRRLQRGERHRAERHSGGRQLSLRRYGVPRHARGRMDRSMIWARSRGAITAAPGGIDAAGQVVVGESDITTTVDPVTGFPDYHAVRLARGAQCTIWARWGAITASRPRSTGRARSATPICG